MNFENTTDSQSTERLQERTLLVIDEDERIHFSYVLHPEPMRQEEFAAMRREHFPQDRIELPPLKDKDDAFCAAIILRNDIIGGYSRNASWYADFLQDEIKDLFAIRYKNDCMSPEWEWDIEFLTFEEAQELGETGLPPYSKEISTHPVV